MKVYDPSGLSEVEEKQQFQTIVKKDLQDLERIVTQEKDSQRERERVREKQQIDKEVWHHRRLTLFKYK